MRCEDNIFLTLLFKNSLEVEETGLKTLQQVTSRWLVAQLNQTLYTQLQKSTKFLDCI